MPGVQVKSVLCEDIDCINILPAGHVVKVLVATASDGLEEQPGGGIVNGEQVEDSDIAASDASQQGVVAGSATRLLTGECCDERVTVEQMMVHGHFLVTFTPDLNTSGDYSLAVLYEGKHVTGSPFFLRFVDAMSLSHVHVERRTAVADAGRPVSLIVSAKEMGKLQAETEGPFGRCATTLKHYEFDMESLSVHFTPKGAGAYTVTVKSDQEEIDNSPFLMLADFSSEEAKECYIFSEDEPLFSKPIRFEQATAEVSFRVSTARAAEQSQGSGDLTVTCSGPGTATIQLVQVPGMIGAEMCTMAPSRPGDYLLSILWKGQHISNSPCTVKFRRAKSTISSNGLNLHQNTYHLHVPYRFRLNCSEVAGKGPEIVCIPSEGARIDVMPVEGRKGVYKCEVLPQLEGVHSISVKIRGKDVEGSPFQVTFKDSCKPSACKIVDMTNSYKQGGRLTMKISTAGAGLGELAATAEDPDNKIMVSLDTKKISDDLYQLELDPGQMSVCNLSVTYGGRQISGSPYWLVFSDPGKFSLKGEGLLGGVVSRWNTFTLEVASPPQQEVGLNVKVKGEHGVTAETKSTSLSDKKFQVKYFPPSPGNYTIDVKWGLVPIPGSHFKIKCSSLQFQIEGAHKRVEVHSKVEIRVRQTGGSALGEDGALEVIAKTLKGNEVRGVACLTNEDERLYTCTLTPTVPGHYMVSVKSNHLHVRGSPFGLKAVSPSKPQQVRVSGAGVEGGSEAGQRVEFTVETAAAGGGLLAVRIQAPSRELHFDTVQDSSNKRTLHVCYCPPVPGEYSVEVMWAGVHVPGSPFRVNILPPMQQTEVMVVADVHSEYDPEDQSFDGNVAVSPETLCPEKSVHPETLCPEESVQPETLCPEESVHLETLSPEESLRPDSMSVVIEEEEVTVGQSEQPETVLPSHVPTPKHTSAEVADIVSATPNIQSYVMIENSECSHDDHVSVAMEERADSAYASAERTTTGSVSTSVHRFLPPQDSVESTYSLYTVPQHSSRRSSDDQIAIHLEGEVPFS